MIDEDVRTLLLTLGPLENIPVEESEINFDTGYTRVWYGRSGSKLDRFLSGEEGIIETSFDIECISNVLATSQTLAAAVYGLDGFRGTMGGTTALAVWVEDQADDYVSKNSWANAEGLFVSSVKLTIQS